MNAVQQKISCVYQIGVSDGVSSKRANQAYKVTATKDLHASALSDGIESARPTEKLDGTCCLVDTFQGQLWLWARHDRKPNKVGERKFAQFKKKQKNACSMDDGVSASSFTWDPHTDFKEVPPNWVPACRLEVRDGFVVPDKLGHTPGWLPVEQTSRQHCWHLSAVNLAQGLALVLRENKEMTEDLILEAVPLSQLCGQTCELVGTNINGNPYGVGNKKQPFHFLVPHGSLSLTCPSPTDQDSLISWFDVSPDAVEGIVWHCENGELYKLHRHHLSLAWPVKETRLAKRKVNVTVSSDAADSDDTTSLFARLACVDGHAFSSLNHLHSAVFPDISDSNKS